MFFSYKTPKQWIYVQWLCYLISEMNFWIKRSLKYSKLGLFQPILRMVGLQFFYINSFILPQYYMWNSNLLQTNWQTLWESIKPRLHSNYMCYVLILYNKNLWIPKMRMKPNISFPVLMCFKNACGGGKEEKGGYSG